MGVLHSKFRVRLWRVIWVLSDSSRVHSIFPDRLRNNIGICERIASLQGLFAPKLAVHEAESAILASNEAKMAVLSGSVASMAPNFVSSSGFSAEGHRFGWKIEANVRTPLFDAVNITAMDEL